MEPLGLDGSPCRRSHSKVAVILILVSLGFLSSTLFNSFSQAADDQSSKAVRRSSAEGAKKVALVIGNKDYRDAPLRNPVNDAEDISNVLEGLGFAVQTKTNLNHRQMDEAVKEFIQKIQNGDVALFYFSGHGAQVKGENYLLPVGVSIESESDVHYDAVPLGRILAKLEESRNKINVVILDACRDNPFKGFRSAGKGLSPVDSPVGTFIAYATAPGSVAVDGTGRNSPYTKHLIEALKIEGIKIDDTFRRVLRAVRQETGGKQNPWVSSCLPDEFYFNPSSSSGRQSDGRRTESEEVVKLREAERLATLERERFEREKRERQQELAKLREAQRMAALEKERIEKEKQQLLSRISPAATSSAPTAPSSITSRSQVVMTYSTFFPKTHAHAILAQQWCDEVAKRTNGAVKVNLFPGGTLTPADQCYDGVVKGISDIGFSVLSYVKGRFWLTEVIDLPLGYKNGAQVTHLVNACYEKFKPKELDDVKVLYLHGHGPGMVHTVKKPVRKLEDLKGMKIRSTGTSAKIAAALGATPVAMPQTETYDALQKGVAEGVLGPLEILKGWKFSEVTNYTTLNRGASYTIVFFHVMNKKKWDALPKDVQTTIEQINKEWIEKTAKIWVDIDTESKEFALAKGHKFIELSQEEDARWADLTKPILAEYVRTTKGKGLPGEAALKFCQEWLKNHPE